MMTRKQEQRQKHREQGQYAKVNPCYHCGKSAGVAYLSHPQTDRAFNDQGLCLCEKCCAFLTSLPDDEALRRLKLSSYGENPQECK